MKKKITISFILVLFIMLGIAGIAGASEVTDLQGKFRAAWQKKDFKGAINIADKLIELTPNDSEAYFARGNTYDQIKQYKEAINDYNKAIELESNIRGYYEARAYACWKNLNFDEALKDFDMVLKLPCEKGRDEAFTDAEIYYAKALVYAQKNDIKSFKENLNLVFKVAQPGDPTTERARKLLNELNKLNLVNNGSQVALATTMTVKPSEGNATMNQLLIRGVENGDLAMVQTAIAKGANVNIYMNTWGASTPLTTAVSRKNLEMVNYLISQGANVNVKTDSCRPPLYVAVENFDGSSMPIVETLVNAGANVMTIDNYGGNLINLVCDKYYVAQEDAMQIVEYLLSKGVGINQKRSGDTPLMSATVNSHIRLVKFLLANGANPALRDNNGRTALDIAISGNKKELIDILLPITPN